MPFKFPSLSTLQSQAISDITTANLPTSNGSLLRNSILKVLAWVQAGFAFGHYGFLQWIANESVPFTSHGEYLEAWAALKGVYRTAASASVGTVTFMGTNGTDIPSGTIVSRSDGVQYRTTADGVISGSTIVIPVAAVTTGNTTNDDAGDTYTLASPIAGINSTAFSSAMTGGSDIESDSLLRTRMLIVYASPPAGGNKNDYLEWALSVPGVTRAWVSPNLNGLGTVTVFTMFDVTESAFNGFPQGTAGGATDEVRIAPATGDLLAVANYIFPLRPVTALVFSVAPVPQTINVEIANLSPSSGALQAAIIASISRALTNIGDPTGSSVYQSEISTAIESVPGVNWFTLVSPSSPVAIAIGSIPVLGTITWS